MKNFKEKQVKNTDARMLSWAARMLYIGALLALIVLIGLQQCCNAERPLSGTYINSAGSEFSLANDTLVLEQVEGNQYQIHRKTGFWLIDDAGRLGKLQRETEEWTAEYDPLHGVMVEKRHGKPISFSADGRVMTVGRRAYQRIN